MWHYEKRLQYPLKIRKPNPAAAKIIITQLGGPDGELGAATRYLSQRYVMPYGEIIGVLTDVGTEELVPRDYTSNVMFLGRRGKMSMCNSASPHLNLPVFVYTARDSTSLSIRLRSAMSSVL